MVIDKILLFLTLVPETVIEVVVDDCKAVIMELKILLADPIIVVGVVETDDTVVPLEALPVDVVNVDPLL